MVILLSVHHTWVNPEQPLVLDTLKEVPEVPRGARTPTVGPQVGPQDLHHGVATLGEWSSAGLSVRVRTARLLVSTTPTKCKHFSDKWETF